MDLQPLIDEMNDRNKLHLIKEKNAEGDEVTFVAAPNNVSLKSIQYMLDETLAKPRRIKGVSTHDTLDSLISHANVFKTEGRSAIFADAQSMVAVYNYDKNNDPLWSDHRAIYKPVYSPEWKAWTEKDGEWMGQADFAAFIEDNALDLTHATRDSDKPQDRVVFEIAKTLNAKIANPAQVIDLARGIAINEAASAKSFYDTATGTQRIEYVTEHQDSAGAKLVVPALFLIEIPVFQSGRVFLIPVRLRYRLNVGKVIWSYGLYKPEKYVEDAIEENCVAAGKATGLTVYKGRPA